MKLALLAILFVPVLASAANSAPAETEPAIIVSRLIVEEQVIVTYYNEATDQVCTYGPTEAVRPQLTCVLRTDLSVKASDRIKQLSRFLR